MQDISRYHVVIICDNAVKNSDVLDSLITRLELELEKVNCSVTRLAGYREAIPVISNDMDTDAILLSTDMELDHKKAQEAEYLLELAANSLPDVPVFLLADRAETSNAISEELMCRAHEYIWIFEDSPLFIAGRISSAIRQYRNNLLPPLMRAVWEYNENRHEYSWAAPGHQGGRGFT